MKKYNPSDFISSISKKTNGNMPNCRFCGGNRFTTTESFASIMIGEDLESLSIGPSVPTGMVICENCGHIDFFALGALGLINKKDVQKNGESEESKK